MPTHLRFLLASPLFFALAGCGSTEVIATLSGTVVDHDGGPSKDVTVALGDKTAVTDAAGRFSFSQVTSPFDVTLIPPGSHDAYVFTGLTAGAPTLALHDRFYGAAKDLHGASIELDLGFPIDGPERAAFIVDRPDELAPIEMPTVDLSGPQQVQLGMQWSGTGGVNVRVRVFKYTINAGGSPQHYTGFATTDLTLAPGGTASWKPSWQAPTFKEKKVSVSVDLPSDYQIFQTELRVRQNGAKRGQSVAWNTGSATAMSFLVPDVVGPVFDIQVCASNGYSASCRTEPGLTAGAAESKSITVEEGPQLSLGGNTLGVGSEIAWSENGDGAGFALFYPVESSGDEPRYFIATEDDAVTIPDLAKLGTKLPKGIDYNVAAFRTGAFETVNELASKGAFSTPTDVGSTYAYALSAVVKTR